MTPFRIAVGILGLIVTVGLAATSLTVGNRLAARRRHDAAPMPAYNLGKFRYLTNPENMQAGSEALISRYRRVWYASMLFPFALIALIPWLLDW